MLPLYQNKYKSLKNGMDRTYEYIFNKVKACLEEDKIYLDPDLSLIKFSKIVGTNTAYLSKAVNACFGKSFRAMLCDYRIEHAKAVIREDCMPLEDLPKGCGFRSKSSFYELFERTTGMTPGMYKKKVMNERKGGNP